MLFKLSLRNIKRSVSDYTIYFITITLAVALFYVFNSINEQQIMLDLTKYQTELLGMLSGFITITSVLVAIVFFILCLFANRFFIKRRKKEFGLYMLLGMGKKDISKILLFETILIAIVAFIVGIGLGTILSQGMAAFTAMIFDFKVNEYQFFFSIYAMKQTIIFFTIIFILVLLFNSFSISKYSLLELLTAAKKSDTLKVKNNKISSGLFITSIILILSGYMVTWGTDFVVEGMKFLFGILLIIVGTLLFYYFGMSFLVSLTQSNKNFYFKNINIFNIRQISSKLTATISSIIMIHFMLLFTMVILSASFSYKSSIEAEVKIVAPYDVSLTVFDMSEFYETEKADISTMLETFKFPLDSFENGVIYDKYETGINGAELFYPYADGRVKANIDQGFPINVSAIRYSDYVKLMKLQGEKSVELEAGQTLILTNDSEVLETIKNLTSQVEEFKVNEKILKLHEEKYQVVAIETENVGRTTACFVIPDELSVNLNIQKTIINLMYSKVDDEFDENLTLLFEKWLNEDEYQNLPFRLVGYTKLQAEQVVAGETRNILYIGIYLGIVFLVSSGAVIGLRQLSDAADEKERYVVLRKIGVTSLEINKSIFLQVFISFLAPLLLAVSHSIFAINYIKNSIPTTGTYNLFIPAAFTIIMLILVYGGYLIASYYGYKKIATK